MSASISLPKEKWIVRGGRAKPLMEAYGLPFLIARVLAGRLESEDVTSFLDRDGELFDPSVMTDLPLAAELLKTHLDRGEKLFIIGDYDVDGMTSSSILYLGLKLLYPAGDIHVRIPERITDGYGFSVEIAREVVEEGCQIVMTCDNGIREFDTAAFLKAKGIPMVITDHHAIETTPENGDRIPEADAVVNPHRAEDPSPQKEICGAFVAYQLIRYMVSRFKSEEADSVLMKQLMGYAALGTVCDVMPLTHENRKLVHQGLRALEKYPTEGIRAMIKTASIKHLDVYAAGFTIGPMINAGGRLGSQNHFFEAMITTSQPVATMLAGEMNALNKTRQYMTDQGIEEGLKQVEEHPDDKVVVLYLPELHESIAGLVAGKVREKTGKPVFVITRSQDGLKGSGRSIEAYSMFESMNRCPELFVKFGGHAMAAGFTLRCEEGHEAEAAEGMREALNRTCTLKDEDFIPIVYIDSTMDPSLMTLDLTKQLDKLGPFGVKNPRPLLAAKNQRLIGFSVFGRRMNAFRLTFECEHGVYQMISFDRDLMESFLEDAIGRADALRVLQGERLSRAIMADVLYQASVNDFNGEEMQLIVKHLRSSHG
ncbi:MAG: single-stranded-DNA-specific exonuclease RecJ [Firmicutes bacterium]|nr:single-stranded-DNA-specific exonuclease RecJ [Bacillota bacterium]